MAASGRWLPGLLAGGLLAAAAGEGVAVLQPGFVDCGGHFEKACGDCPQGNGETWCNGQCTWLYTSAGEDDGMCVNKVAIPGIPPERSPLGANFYYWAVGAAGSVVVQAVFAFIFYVRVVAGPPEMPKVGALDATPARRHIFDCLQWQNRETCMYTTFCLPMIAAKNLHIAGVMPYWVGWLLMCIVVCSPFATWQYWPGVAAGATLLTLVRVILSLTIQRNLGFSPNVVKTCVYNIFCMPCDIGRESLEADAEIGAQLQMGFNVQYTVRAVTEVENLVERAAERSCMSKTRLCGPGH